MRSTTRARLAAAAAGLAAIGLLGGCGIADPGVQPGVAAEVGDTSISLDDVDDTADELCDLRAEDPLTINKPVSGAEVRTRALQTLVLREIADGLAADNDITPSPTFESLQQAAEDAGTYQALETVGVSYLVNVMQAVGKQDPGAGASEEDQLTAGIKAAQEWTEQAGVRTNPVFPDIAVGDQAVEFTRDDDLSTAVSQFAQDALADSERLDSAPTDSEFAQTLPESQRCG